MIDMYKDLKGWRWWLWMAVNLAAIIVAMVFASSCSRKCVPVTVEDVRTVTLRDTVERVRLRVDSVHVADSIVTVIRGDTVLTDRWHTEYRDRLRVDTVEKVRTLTEYRTRTDVQTVEVERKRRWWETALLWCGGVAVITLVVCIGWILHVRK